MTISEPLNAAFIHSPLLSPITWRAVSDALKRMGQTTQCLDLRDALGAGGDFYGAFGRLAAAQIVDRSLVIAHSGAGGIVPSVLHYASGRVRAVMFVDALLPHPRRSWMATAPRALAERLRADARNCLAPPWPRWLPETLLTKLLPDAAMRMSLITEAPAVPLAFLEEPAPDGTAWATSCASAYLQLSSNYDVEASQARALGWPVDRYNGHHLSMMTEPAQVAEAIVGLAARLDI